MHANKNAHRIYSHDDSNAITSALNGLQAISAQSGDVVLLQSFQKAPFSAIRSLYIVPGLPWQNGFIKSFNDRTHRELLDRKHFCTLSEARIASAG